MKNNILKHTNLNCILLGLCFVVILQTKGFAQHIPLQKTLKKDSLLNGVPNQKKHKKTKPIRFNGSDGPYIINDSLLYTVSSKNRLTVSPFFNRDSVLVKIDNADKNEFYVSLKKEHTIPETVYSLPEKMIVISDIEGKYDAFAGFLYANKIIDENHNWIYGNGHLVLGGDFVDRGKNVTQVLWLIYKLEQQAEKQHGVVHFILGNHEILNFYGDHRYNRGKYIKAAQEISLVEDQKEAIKHIYSKHSELGKWLASKNVIEKIGGYIFVHAGLSPEILDYKLDLEAINKRVRLRLNGQQTEDKVTDFLFSLKGPFWYRGLVKTRFQYNKITATELEAILKYYNSEKIVIGHTPVKEISTGFNGRIIITDVNHGKTKFSGKTKGLLIENNQEFIIDDNAVKVPLEIKLQSLEMPIEEE
ncbi:metallophosphoesterase [Lacinutrix mariniflava]|uniref:metallophosphoesterase n=1 Tax=Lacinutrix mariniflava TaxID=342955 RepID=UPI0006E37DE1|nr:metallophosphoesterase [Lacinutrix mariniflava]